MIEQLSYFGTGIFWFSAFLALIIASYGVARYGYGQDGAIYVVAPTTKVQLGAGFVVLLLAVNAVVWSVLEVVTTVL